MSNDTLAKYATIEEESKGRLYKENYDDTKYRSIFGRDRDRIIGSSAFHRLQYKTQVFVNHHGDHYRTRLTHSLEVAQTARWIAGGLQLNKDLAEIVALAHDLGHPPFGHAGEDALNEKMQIFVKENSAKVNFATNFGFMHNAHTLKIITKIENRFIDFAGLNLTWETLEGVAKHNGPIDINLPHTSSYIIEYNKKHDLDLAKFSSLEAQIAAIADDITYNNHDVEDGLRANLFDIEQLFNLPLIGKIYQEILAKYPNIRRELLVGEAKKHIVLAMILDVINNTGKNISQNKIETQEDVRNCNKSLVCFSSEMEIIHQTLKKFLMENVYRHKEINRMTANAKIVIKNLFNRYVENPNLLPLEYQIFDKNDLETLAISTSDYIAGMTDRFAIKEYKNLFDIK